MICKTELKVIPKSGPLFLHVWLTLWHGCLKFLKIQEPSQNSKHQNSDTNKLHTKASQILGATVQNLVAFSIWCPVFVLPSLMK